MDPFFSKKLSGPEKKFIGYLNKSKKIKWWYKNGDTTEPKYFAVPYKGNDGDAAFYVDWIIRFNNGKVGLFDTKSGFTAEKAGPKHDGLYKFMKTENKKRKKLVGGIVVQDRSGKWKYSNKEKYDYDKNDLISWEYLDKLLS